MQELRAIYRQADAAYAPFSCPASGECCQLSKTRRQPWLWYPEWKLLASHRPLPPPREDGGCPYLDAAGKRCTVYADRPFGCRTFFCERIRGPARQPADTVDALLRRLEAVSQRILPDRPPAPAGVARRSPVPAPGGAAMMRRWNSGCVSAAGPPRGLRHGRLGDVASTAINTTLAVAASAFALAGRLLCLVPRGDPCNPPATASPPLPRPVQSLPGVHRGQTALPVRLQGNRESPSPPPSKRRPNRDRAGSSRLKSSREPSPPPRPPRRFAAGLRQEAPSPSWTSRPLADGGPGTVDALLAGTPGRAARAHRAGAARSARPGGLRPAGLGTDGDHRDGRGLGVVPAAPGGAGCAARLHVRHGRADARGARCGLRAAHRRAGRQRDE